MSSSGRVTLVGAGPGDPDLITLAGLSALSGADVVVHDRLVSRELLAHAPPQAEIIDAGKRPTGSGSRGMAQDQINALLIERAQRGLQVVRLKGGDPFVFGRGGEEADALRDADVPFEVIPGISSATAAAALAGIPVTDRRHASSFTVVTGQEADNDAPPIDWRAIARTGGTIVVLMGWRALPEISVRLIDARPGRRHARRRDRAGLAARAAQRDKHAGRAARPRRRRGPAAARGRWSSAASSSSVRGSAGASRGPCTDGASWSPVRPTLLGDLPRCCARKARSPW